MKKSGENILLTGGNESLDVYGQLQQYKKKYYLFSLFNRPGVAGAVLQTASSFSNSWFVEIYSKHCQSQTGRARELKF